MAQINIASEVTAKEVENTILTKTRTEELKQKIKEIINFIKELNRGE